MDEVYLKPNTTIQPYINHWYAWSHLLSPVNYAMYLNEAHLPLLESFVAAPHIHEKALTNPKLLGGKFVQHNKQAVDSIKSLCDKTTQRCTKQLKLAKENRAFANALANLNHGESLASLYATAPDTLQGYIELLYNGSHSPSVRYFESLYYQSEYYDPKFQQITLESIDNDYRPFALNTPKLPEQHGIHLDIPFNDKRLDVLATARYEPIKFSSLVDILDLNSDQQSTLKTLVTDKPVLQSPCYESEKPRIRYFGHASVLIEYSGVAVLIDPALSYDYQTEISRFTLSDLPASIDYVLITHNHMDHFDIETLIQIRSRVKNIVVPKNNVGSLFDPSLKLALKTLGYNAIHEVNEFDELVTNSLTIHAIPFLGEHADLEIYSKLAYLVRIADTQILFAADSCNMSPSMYDHVRRIYGTIDYLFIGTECEGAPMNWLYAPYLSVTSTRKQDQSRRLNGSNAEQAFACAKSIGASHVFLYAMGQEPWLNHITNIFADPNSVPIEQSNKFLALCESSGLHATRLFAQAELIL